MENKVEIKIDENLKHIAFIMDGNGRWAKAKGMERTEGHKEGVKALQNMCKTCMDIGLEAVTFYAFSTENWKRPVSEVKTIMGLLSDFLDENENGKIPQEVRFRVIGDKSALDYSLRKKLERIEEETKHYKRCINLAINYGGRDEIVNACNKLVKEGKEITKENLTLALYTEDCVDPDMIIRTAGEKRLSNFLLWQASYSEFYFTDVLWPDFNDEELKKAIDDFYSRRRRYGGL